MNYKYDSNVIKTQCWGVQTFEQDEDVNIFHNLLKYIPPPPFSTAIPCLKKIIIEPWPKHNRKCNGFNGYNGNCIGFNGNYNGVYWYVMDYIGGVLNHIVKMPKTQ